VVTKYLISEIEDYNEFLNHLFKGLKHYQKKEPGFRFKIKYNFKEGTIELTTIKIDASSN